MTATIAGRLVDWGLISWDTRVGVQSGITFENSHWNELLVQTGTIPQVRRCVSDTVLTEAPQVTPGNFLHSNQGYTVVATMLELISGKDWETLMQEETFTPSRMTTATLGIIYDDETPPRAPAGHDPGAGQTVPVPRSATSASVDYHSEASNGAGAYTACTLQDWVKFLHQHMTSDLGDYLTTATGARLEQPFPGPSFAGADGYGRGVNVHTNSSWAKPGNGLYHGGDVWGNDSIACMSPGRDFIVVAYVNCHPVDSSAILAMSDAANLLISSYAGVLASGPWLEIPTDFPPRRLTNGSAFDYLTLCGVRYRVETSRDLRSWITNNNGANGQIATSLRSSFMDTNLAPQKFYRARVLP